MTERDYEQYGRLFMPSAYARRARVEREGLRFAYYTTASTAISVIRSKKIWMRSLLVMNDYSEVQHGLDCLKEALDGPAGKHFKNALDGTFPGLSTRLLDLFTSWVPGLGPATYVTCLSEHAPEDDRFGRLSMWRAYGGDAGIALIVRPDFMSLETDQMGAFTSPVAYMNGDDVREELARIAVQLEANAEKLQAFGEPIALNSAFDMLRYAALCTKHPAFLEEREWRILACPTMHPTDILKSDTEVVGGIPQRVLKLPLESDPERGIVGLEPKELIDKVLIGPCEHTQVIWQAVVHALGEAGIENPQDRVVVTGIPLRSNQR